MPFLEEKKKQSNSSGCHELSGRPLFLWQDSWLHTLATSTVIWVEIRIWLWCLAAAQIGANDA